MKLKTLLLLILSIAALTQNSAAQKTTTEKIDELMKAYTEAGKFNGSVLVARNGHIFLQKGYGYRDIVNHALNDSSTVFEIASITKQFTSSLILKLVELKRLSLSDKLSKFYPGFPNGDSITIENLLTHTSGIFDYTQDRSFTPSDEQKMINFLKSKKPDFVAGAEFRYSNSGYYLLGLIIQQLTGMSYEQAMKKYIFMPLRMNSSGMNFKELVTKGKAIGYYADSTEKPEKIAPLANLTGPFAAGAIYSTVGDLYKWHEGLQSYKIITKGSLQKAWTPFKNNYGYGWIVDSVAGKRFVSHSGGIPGFRSNFARMPEDNICIVLLNNTEEVRLENITQKIFFILYDHPYSIPVTRTAVPLKEEILRQYIGTYELKERNLVIEVMVQNGQLIAQPIRGPRSVLSALDESHFFIADEEAFDISFERDETGKVDKMIINHMDRKGIAQKIK